MLETKIISVVKACTGKFGKTEIKQKQLDDFEFELKQFHDKFNALNENETEEHFKNIFRDFLNKAFYENKNYMNTKSFSGLFGSDMVIHDTADVNSRVEVLLEFKRLSNKSGMITTENLNKKAMHEAVLYYLQERMKNKNIELKYIIITNFIDFFIFDAKYFHKIFYENTTIRNTFSLWSEHKTDDDSTKLMYDVISNQICEMNKSIDTIHFNLKNYTRFNSKTNKSKIKQLYQILSPRFLFKETAKQDSNELNKDFYNELLYIMGLEEYKEKNKKLIRRCESRQSGTLLENTITQMKTHTILHPENYGENIEEQQFNYALQMNITWINRILFLKLLEAQLISYHNNDNEFAFLKYDKVNSYNDLADLFFKVLALKEDERQSYIIKNYPNLPYLNSSLFDRSQQEQEVSITELTNLDISIYAKTVLKTGKKKISGRINTLEYLLRFLDAYNFGSKIVPGEEKKSLINASVLGLIFEKINGYKEGSFYTPGYITMYMSRETLRRAVLDKLNNAFERDFTEFDELKNYTNNIYKSGELQKANDVLNSITICDPAVGSGHFLVSTLNEMITIKSELGILCDTEGKPRRDWNIQVINDELNIHDGFGEPFEYKLNEFGKPHSELQKIQETMFREKQTIIENCLFGVDINPNSVNICRLRLWIELLKNSYYTNESNFKYLHTLPNIDINIKCGNSLISRFNLEDSLSTVLKKTNMTVAEYLTKVRQYKNAINKQEKLNLISAINEIKSKFKKQMMHQMDVYRKFARLERKYESYLEDQDVFEENRKIKQNKKEFERTEKAYNKAKAEWEVWESGEIYRNAFEWRFEFPEVLDDEGKFIGFDIVIGNPPYIVIKGSRYSNFEYSSKQIDYVKDYYMTAEQQINTYTLFIERSNFLLNINGVISLIIPNTVLANDYSKKIRNYLLRNNNIISIDNLGIVFKDASVEVMILTLIKFNDSLIETRISLDLNNYWTTNLRILSNITKGKKLLISVKDYEQNLIKKISYNNLLINYAKIWRGLTTGNDNAFIASGKVNQKYKPLISGSEVCKYQLKGITKYVLYDVDKLDRPRDERIFLLKEKLISKFIGTRLTFCYDDKKNYVVNTACILEVINNEVDIKYLLGLLNSSLLTYYFVKVFTDHRSTFPIMKSGNLESLPIVIGKEQNINKIISLVESIQSNNKDYIRFEREIDIITYQLYNLNYEEVLIVDPDFGLSEEEYEKFKVE